MEFEAKLGNLSSMLAFITAEATKAGFKEKEIGLIELACEEAIVNVIHHAYKEEGNHKIGINLKKLDEGIEVAILDQGIAFDAKLVNSEIDINQPASERKIGGLGIFLIRQVADNLEYSRKENKNITKLTFVLNSPKRIGN